MQDISEYLSQTFEDAQALMNSCEEVADKAVQVHTTMVSELSRQTTVQQAIIEQSRSAAAAAEKSLGVRRCVV